MFYTYTHKQITTDVRTWVIETEELLTKYEVETICNYHGYVEEQTELPDNTGTIEFAGLEIGDDCDFDTTVTGYSRHEKK